MDGNEEGGVCTQKVNLTAIAVIMIAFTGIAGALVLADDASAVSFNIEMEEDYVKVSGSITYTVSWTDADDYKYEAILVDSDGEKVSSGISSGSSGTCSDSGASDVVISAPSKAGDYRLKVTFTNTETEETIVREAPLKVVDPIKLTVTLKNSGEAAQTLKVYFYINGEKMEDSGQEVTISGNGTKDVTYNYVVKDVKETKYYVDVEGSGMSGEVSGLGPNSVATYYTHANDFTIIEAILIIALILLLIGAIYIYRKPIKNYGRPKGRR